MTQPKHPFERKPTSTPMPGEVPGAVPAVRDSSLPDILPPARNERTLRVPGHREVKTLLPMIRFTFPGQRAEVTFLGIRRKIGPNESNVYIFDWSGNRVGMWGSTILDSKMDLLNPAPGQKMILVYDGEVETSRKAKPARNVRVFIPGEEISEDADTIPDDDPPPF